jgi:hypothetical protein
MFVTDKRQAIVSPALRCAQRGPTKGRRGFREAPRKGGSKLAPPESLDVILADRITSACHGRCFAHIRKSHQPGGIDTSRGDQDNPIAVSHGSNQLDRLKHKVDAGFNVHLTIDPDSQRIVQQMSKCYAGDSLSCQRFGLASDKQFSDFTKQMYEKAAVRMAAVALIDIPSGKIEALGSAHTDCYRQEFDGPGRNAGECPNLPSTPHYEPDRLLNHALFTDALPGSIIKPIMATGFLRDPLYSKKIVADRVSADFIRLQDELKSSDSVAFSTACSAPTRRG